MLAVAPSTGSSQIPTSSSRTFITRWLADFSSDSSPDSTTGIRKRLADCSTVSWDSWHFWLFTIGFHLTFDTMHIPGLLGMPRRIYTYDAGRGWETLNFITSLGALVQAAGLSLSSW